MLAVVLVANAADTSTEVRLLGASPSCVKDRLGQVSVTLGSREPNLRTGMAPTTVRYRDAFAKLQAAASAKGGEAVVLRGHEAGYFTKGAKKARRPTFLSLQGAVVTLHAHGAGCALAALDPAEYERDVSGKEPEDVVIFTGTAF
ncbi:hypothetical protein MNR01_13250 [Lysobacter sp. S4-A87]|uniref:hypothetical protein n=1 Tax=Lysobacter sp. S4-A87 TaxID=2925843 RepID=UPI001F53956B|nr:hypothetical protein [Lysobacter sp. S4-A87]UNK48703.1 hypothetical protein MNR01_13250 [Lysobacter sp. S4-A87]